MSKRKSVSATSAEAPTPKESPNDILTAGEVCLMLDWSRKTLYNYTHAYKGRPPLLSSYRSRGETLVRRKQLEFFLKKIEVKGVFHLSEAA